MTATTADDDDAVYHVNFGHMSHSIGSYFYLVKTFSVTIGQLNHIID